MRILNPLRRAVDLIDALRMAMAMAERDHWTRSQILVRQREGVMRIVRHAAERTKFYNGLYRGIDLSGAVDIKKLPIVTKRQLMSAFDTTVTDRRLRYDDLQAHLYDVRGDQLYLDEYRVVATAGTSGLRGIFVYDRDAWRVVLTNTLRWQAMIGVGPRLPRRTRIASIGADNPMHVTSRIPMTCDVGLFRLLHIEATAAIKDQVAALTEFEPDVLLPYPSVAALLAREQIAGRLAIKPRVIATHSEVLTPDMIRLMEQAWGITPFNHYGMTEEPHVGSDCPLHAGMHVFEDTTLLEVVDDDYRPVPDGQPGTRWLLTNLYNFTQPLIRYEVTDMLCRSPTPCACGRPFALVTSMAGRSDDMLRLRRQDGTGEVNISPMLIGLAIENFAGVREYAADHDDTGIAIRIAVPDPADRARIDRDLVRRLQGDLAAQGAIAPPISLTFIDALPRSAGRMGKIALVARRRGPSPA